MAEKLTAEEFKARVRKCSSEVVKHPEAIEKMKDLGIVFQMIATNIDYRWVFDCMAEPKFVEGMYENPTVTTEATSEVFTNIYEGTLSGTKALVTRKVKIKGPMIKAMRMNLIMGIIVEEWAKAKSELKTLRLSGVRH